MLRVCAGIDDESNIDGKSQLKRIVSMLTRLIQRSQSVAENALEYEYRSAEYEYEEAADDPIGRKRVSVRFNESRG